MIIMYVCYAKDYLSSSKSDAVFHLEGGSWDSPQNDPQRSGTLKDYHSTLTDPQGVPADKPRNVLTHPPSTE